ncbi:hypothetical protein Tco_0310847, partial [Tanacetum coccineum]
LEWKFEKIYVTQTHFGRKWTRLQLYTKVGEEGAYSAWRRCRHFWRQRQDTEETASEVLVTASGSTDLKKLKEDSAW